MRVFLVLVWQFILFLLHRLNDLRNNVRIPRITGNPEEGARTYSKGYFAEAETA